MDKENDNGSFIESSMFDHLAFNIFIFVVAIISIIIMFIVIKLIFKGEKMQALVANLAMIRGIKAISEEIEAIVREYWIIIIWLSLIIFIMFIVIKLIFKGEKMQALVANLAMIRGIKAISEEIEAIVREYWIIIIWLSLILFCVLFLTIEKLYRMPIFRKYHYSNTIKIMIFISDIKSYVPIKLCKTSGSIHLFKLTGSINKENITLHKNTVWDIMEIDWRPVTVTLGGNVINLPGSVIIPFRDKFKIRRIIKSKPLLLHLMLKQGQTWYPLSNIRDMMEIENNGPQSVEMHIEP